MKISSNNVTEVKLHQFAAEASDLGLPVLSHEWPVTFETTLGNGQPLVVVSRTAEYVLLLQNAGIVSVKIFND